MANLRIPGPTPCSPEVLEALTQQMINHRGPEFAALLESVTDGLRPFFQTENDILIPTCSGTGAMEAAIVNTMSPGDKALAVSIGSFGDRFGTIAETYGADVTRIEIEWGQALEPDVLREALREETFDVVILTHNETSTGVTNPLGPLCEVVHAESDALLLVDAVSSMGCMALPTDEWGIDIVVTGSQKGWGVPPGLAMLAVSEKAWKAGESATMPRFYLDLKRHLETARNGQTPWTPAISLFYGLDVALKQMAKEGQEAIHARHARIGAMARQGAKDLGLELFADERYASNTVTAVKVPDGIDGKELNKVLREKYDTVMGGGQGKLAGKIFRIGHLGWVHEPDIEATLEATGKALADLGYAVASGAPARS